jgi:hypothetical protein
MKQRDLVRLLILAIISDDYEEPTHIYDRLTEEAQLCGISVQPADIHQALADLINLSLAKAYKLSTTEPSIEVQGVPPVENSQGLFFWATDKGRAAVVAARDDQWPFDDEGALRAGWRGLNG